MSEPTWNLEEERFLNKIRRSPTEKQIADVHARCQAELKQSMQVFIGAHANPITQKTIEYLAEKIRTKYNNELISRGLDYEITFNRNL